MKIAVCPADLHGCGYYRMLTPFMALAAQYGHDVRFCDSPLQVVPRWSRGPQRVQTGDMVSAFDDVDVIVLQRQTKLENLRWAYAQKQRGKKIVHEWDDNFHAVPASNPAAVEYGPGKEATIVTEGFCRLADLCIVSTESLATEYGAFNRRIAVCENAILDSEFDRLVTAPVDCVPKRTAQIRIGYAGSATHLGDFSIITRSLAAVMREHIETRMVFVGADLTFTMPSDLRSRCEFFGFTQTAAGLTASKLRGDFTRLAPVRYMDALRDADLDIHLAPLASTTFNRCKSDLKALQAGIMGAPIVASSFGPYRACSANGAQYVALASEPEDWRRTLSRLVADRARRIAYADANRRNVQANRLMSTCAAQWQAALASIASVEAVA